MIVSLITAVYNNKDTILDTLRSIRAQSHRQVQHVVVDGASTDGTLDILLAHRSEIDVLISEPDNGIYDALNKGLRYATGDVVGFLHADDVLAHPFVLASVDQTMVNAYVEAAYGDLLYVHKCDPNRVLRRWVAGPFEQSKLSWGWMPPHPTFYVRRCIYTQLGGFDTSFRIAADYDCMLRFLKHGIRLSYIPSVLVKMRSGGVSNSSLPNIVRKMREDYRALDKNGVGGFGALICKNVRKTPQFFGTRAVTENSLLLSGGKNYDET